MSNVVAVAVLLWELCIVTVFGVDCRKPPESALLSPNSLDLTEVSDYCE